MPDNNHHDLLADDPTCVVVHDAELVRREGRTLYLRVKDALPPDPPLTPPRDETPPPELANPLWLRPPEQEGWLGTLLSCMALLLLAGLCALHVILGSRPLSTSEVLVLLVIAVLLFGRKLPEVGRYFGKGIVEFKKGVKGLEDDLNTTAAVAPHTERRRATVRYYSRMNPERVYPLLVMITRDMIAKVQKKHVDQRESGPFEVDLDSPIEIEPVLPGCDCHPPRVVTRLGQGDLTLTFRVVPRVPGRVDGAVVSIRQDHTSLAEIDLDAKVVKQTWLVLSGTATFLLPGLSAVMKHFGLDFETQKEQGFSLYLAFARLVFDQVSPYTLTAALGVATALLWWLTRPRTRDVFHDIEKVKG